MQTLSTNYDSDEIEMAAIESSFESMDGETLEKSLTNLNINNALMVSQVEAVGDALKELNANFCKQLEMLAEKVKRLRMQTAALSGRLNRCG